MAGNESSFNVFLQPNPEKNSILITFLWYNDQSFYNYLQICFNISQDVTENETHSVPTELSNWTEDGSLASEADKTNFEEGAQREDLGAYNFGKELTGK